MAKNTKIGDVFSVSIDGLYKKYFQYIVSDITQLNSDVIRVFKNAYPLDSKPDLNQVVKGDVEFYAHCVTKLGVQLGYWKKEGNILDIGKVGEITFRDSTDYGKKVEYSDNWWLWKANEDQRFVGRLYGENRKAEIGIVISPDSIVHRMKTGEYDFVYPRMNDNKISNQ